MKVLIYIELLDKPSEIYEKEIISWAKLNIPDISCFDLDNFSDQYMFKYALELIEKEEKIVLIIDVIHNSQAGKVLGIIEKAIKHKEKCMVLMNGENKMLEKMLSLLKEQFKKNLGVNEYQEQVTLFFQM